MKNAGFGEKEMIDKELFKLIGKNKKYMFIAVLLQVIGLIANVELRQASVGRYILHLRDPSPLCIRIRQFVH